MIGRGCVIITGASRGIGKACAMLLSEKYNVICTYNNSYDDAISIEREINSRGYGKCVFVKCDVTKITDIVNVFAKADEYGGLIGVVNNAGVSLVSLMQDTPEIDHKYLFDVNYKGTFDVIKIALRRLINQKRGSIVNISSMWGQYGGSMESAYSASKAAVIGLTKSLSKELGPSNIRVNCICPGVIDTDMNKHLSDDDKCDLIEKTPLMRLGKPSDVANLVDFLISDKSSFITGQVIGVDGGINSI